jgi:hypothetical protein
MLPAADRLGAAAPQTHHPKRAAAGFIIMRA